MRNICRDISQQVAGRRVASVKRRGKKILIGLEPAGILCIHLGMTGQLTVESADAPTKPHTHFLVEVDDRKQLRFRDPRRFGGIWWLDDEKEAESGLGPEPLTIRPQRLARLLSRTRRAIKAALLDQALIAGLGNIYADEALFRARIHPLAPAHALTVDHVRRLNRAIKLILRQAIRHRGSSISDYIDVNGQSGRFQNLHQVYGREGKPCTNCGTPLQRIVVCGRSTHFCPRCQPLHRPAARIIRRPRAESPPATDPG